MNNLSAPIDRKQRMCERCMALFDEDQSIIQEGRFYCPSRACQTSFEQEKECCVVCKREIVGKVIKSNGKSYHPECFNCDRCQCNLQFIDCTVFEGRLLCTTCYHRLNSPHCERCGQQIMPGEGELETKQITIGNATFCKGCFSCQDCGVMLWAEESGGAFYIDLIYCCKKCHRKRRKANFLKKRQPTSSM